MENCGDVPSRKCIRLSRSIQRELARAIRESPRSEICGLILRNPSGQQYFRQLPNRFANIAAFFISHVDARRAIEAASDHGEEVIAWIHSHAYSIEGSNADARWLSVGSHPWIIVTLAEGGIRYRTYYGSVANCARGA